MDTRTKLSFAEVFSSLKMTFEECEIKEDDEQCEL